MTIFNIVDPGMSQKAGHHREINMALAAELAQRGYQVNIYAHKTYPVDRADMDNPDIRIIPHFTVFPYAVLKNDHALTTLAINHHYSQIKFEEELFAIKFKGDIHFSNIFSYQIKGLSKISGLHKSTACIHVHPNRYTPHGEFFWIKSVTDNHSHMKKFQIFSVEALLSNEIDRLSAYGNIVKTIPFPLKIKEIPAQKSPTHRIGILGGLRPSQGFEKLSQTLQLIHGQGYEVLLQDPRGQVKNLEGVKKIGFLDCFADAFNECDAVLLNYEPEAYKFMGSGVMWEALANGIPVIYSKGSAVAHLGKTLGAGIPFSYHDASSLKEALHLYKNHQEKWGSDARKIAVEIRSKNTISHYLDQLI